VKKPKSYSEAFRTPTVVTVKFQDEQDALDLVENCNKDMQTEMTIRGRKLAVEWPSTDCRRMGIRAPTDASSELSYQTDGTRFSKSTMIAKRERPAVQRPAPSDGAAAAAPANASNQGWNKYNADDNYVPLANRSVILSGLPTDLKDYDVRSEVVSLLQREWRKANLPFDVRTHLHKGKEERLESAIEVRKAHRPGDQNGTVMIRFLNYADAKWLAEKAKNLRILGNCHVFASWANPRGQKGGRRS